MLNTVTLHSNLSGTGSYPDAPQGWHLNNLFIVKIKPLKLPCLFIASSEYLEHVGLNLHCFPKKGESRIWYNLIKDRKMNFTKLDKNKINYFLNNFS